MLPFDSNFEKKTSTDQKLIIPMGLIIHMASKIRCQDLIKR